MTALNLPAVYVKAAIEVMKYAHSEAELLAWWKLEETNRRKWELSPDEMPGKLLKEKLLERRGELRSEALILETQGN